MRRWGSHPLSQALRLRLDLKAQGVKISRWVIRGTSNRNLFGCPSGIRNNATQSPILERPDLGLSHEVNKINRFASNPDS